MDIISRKLNLVQEFLRITNDKIIDKLERALKAEQVNTSQLEEGNVKYNQ